MSSVILNELLLHLNKLGHCRKQSTLSLELVVRVTLQTDLNDKSMAKLALNLWQLCLKGNNVDMKYMVCMFLVNLILINILLHFRLVPKNICG